MIFESKWFRLLLLGVALLVLAGLGVWAAEYFSAENRSDRAIARAVTSFDEGDQEDGIEATVYAANLRNSALTEILEESRRDLEERPEVLAALTRELQSQVDLTPAQMRFLAGANLRTRNYEEAGMMAAGALQADPVHPETIKYIAIIRHLTGDHGDAINFFQSAYDQNYRDPEMLLYFARALMSTDDPINRTRAKVLLKEVGKGKSMDSLRALLYLVTDPVFSLSAEEQVALLEEIRNHPRWDSPLVNENLALLRNLTMRYEQFDPEFAYQVAKKLIQHPERTESDVTAYIFIGQMSGNYRDVTSELKQFDDRESVEFIVLRANQAFLEKRNTDGVTTLQKAFEKDPGYPVTGLVARRVLNALDSGLTLGEQEALLDIVIQHERTPTAELLDAYDRKLQLRPLKADETYAGAIAEMRKRGELEVLAAWLLAHNAFERLLDVFSEESVQQRPTLAPYVIRAALGTDNSERARRVLDEASSKLSDLTREILEATYAQQTGDREEALRHWETAYGLAEIEASSQAMIMLGRLAVELNSPDEAIDAYRAAFRDQHPFSTMDLLQYFTLVSNRNDLAEISRVAHALWESAPSNPVFVNNDVYFRLLRRTDLEDSVQRMEAVVDQNPDTRNFRLTLALAYLLNEQVKRAEQVASKTRVELTSEAASSQAIYAAIMDAAGQRALANSIVANIDRSRLRPEEWALIEHLVSDSIR